VSRPTPGNPCGAHPCVGPCVLIDKVGPSVVPLSHTLVIVGGSQLRPPVIRGPLGDKGQRMERRLICRAKLVLTGNMHAFYTRGACTKRGSLFWSMGFCCLCEGMFLWNKHCLEFAPFVFELLIEQFSV